jgi:hypothetical protein
MHEGVKYSIFINHIPPILKNVVNPVLDAAPAFSHFNYCKNEFDAK